ncbi:hypothetical protein BH09VER1_BH09VER1_51510 [soil metagenome]
MASPATHSNLPSEEDFDPCRGQLDAQTAWRNFGGLQIPAAYEKFCEHPYAYQENFMFMGPRAFRFYFPVIDRFLREHEGLDDYDNSEAWILGQGIIFQLAQREDDSSLPHLEALASFVRANLARYCTQPENQRRIDHCWQEVQTEIRKLKF